MFMQNLQSVSMNWQPNRLVFFTKWILSLACFESRRRIYMIEMETPLIGPWDGKLNKL
jgi:hypothetical protein